jgi:AraC-like DNA-binding protein
LKPCGATLKPCRRGRQVGSPVCATPTFARALALLHHDITRPWSVDDLSREVGLSRSALAVRFISLIGMPPMHYVASWRMQVATQKLRNTSASLAQVADLVGYSSRLCKNATFMVGQPRGVDPRGQC